MKTVIGLVGAGMLFGSAVALAQSNETPGVDARQEKQERRIQEGVAGGRLTPREANRLEKKLDRIEKMEEKAKSDGKVTLKERKRLHQALDQNSRAIAKEKHDRQGARRPVK